MNGCSFFEGWKRVERVGREGVERDLRGVFVGRVMGKV